jgi:ribosomal protein L24
MVSNIRNQVQKALKDGIVKKKLPIQISNISLIDPKTKG